MLEQFAQAIVARKIQNHEFTVKTSIPNVEVSWQVTGVRHDAFAMANPLVVEEEKDARLRGFYIHPELHGAPAERQIGWARHPQIMMKMQQQRQEINEGSEAAQCLSERIASRFRHLLGTAVMLLTDDCGRQWLGFQNLYHCFKRPTNGQGNPGALRGLP